jgi:FAD/FMN-containing dehydrogenase
VVAAESAAAVSAAVRFASAHNVRLVVKGRGHSYFGASNAPDSLLVWTPRMDTISLHDAFTPAGSGAAPVPAVSVGAGGMWLHTYQAVTGGAGRYVQGGGCTTVGVAGLVQGGGFGHFSKAYGTAAASLLEAEIVTADGVTRVVNDAREPDLFWALKGGGGGTFSIVTRFTLATHPLPETLGAVSFVLKARRDWQSDRRLAWVIFRVSGTRYFVLTGIVIHDLRWHETLNRLVSFRQRMRTTFGLQMREEIHAGPMISHPGSLARIF